MAREFTETMQVRMTPREAKRLAWLAKREMRTVSGVLRKLVNDEYARQRDVLKHIEPKET